MKYIDLFAGVGGFRTAFDKAGFECLFSSEKDKHASKAYEVLYGDKPDGDITQIDAEYIPEHDILTGGFPCQAYSIAGQRQGMQFECKDCGHEHVVTFNEYKDVITCPFCGSGGTEAKDDRGLLFFEIARIASEKKPNVLLLENVKGLLSHNKGKTIELILETLSEIGYTIDFTILNSKYYDVPQQRERVFIVGVLDWITEPYKITGNNVLAKTKKRISELGVSTFNFDWPNNNEVTTKLADILEENPDEKYYLSEEKTAKLIAQLEESFLNKPNSSSKEPSIEVVGLLDMKGNEATRRVDAPKGLSPALTTMGGGHREPKVLEPQQLTRGDGISYCIDANYNKGISNLVKAKRTHVIETYALTERRTEEAKKQRKEYREKFGKDFSSRRGKKVVPRNDNLANCLTATQSIEQMLIEKPKYRIRKLTPLECFRLQGFPDEYYSKLRNANISNTQLYKMAGNAVTVTVVYEIAKKIKELFR